MQLLGSGAICHTGAWSHTWFLYSLFSHDKLPNTHTDNNTSFV